MKHNWLNRPRLFAAGGVSLLVAGILVLRTPTQVHAYPNYLTQAESLYGLSGTAIDSCTLCHNSDNSRNAFGLDFAANLHSFAAIEALDSDGDGYSNLAEINAHTYPGDRTSQPAPVPPTATKVPPTATKLPPTATSVPPTATKAPPTATKLPPTATSVPPTATKAPPTATKLPPTATNVPPAATNVPPAATNVPPAATNVPPSATKVPPTATDVPPSATNVPPNATRVPPTVTPGPTQRITIAGIVRSMPASGYIGDWMVGSTTVHVRATTRVIRGESRIRVGSRVVVSGARLRDGSVLADAIVAQGRGEESDRRDGRGESSRED